MCVDVDGRNYSVNRGTTIFNTRPQQPQSSLVATTLGTLQPIDDDLKEEDLVLPMTFIGERWGCELASRQ